LAEDKELRKIKLRRFKEMLRGSNPDERPKETKQGESNNGTPINITDATFEKEVQGNPLAVIDCWAPWCGPCRFVGPIINELARDYTGRIFFGKLNVDENQKTAMKYGIMSIPTLLVFKKGRLVDRIVGAMPRQRLEPMITRHL
jgi:thioredoxin 1